MSLFALVLSLSWSWSSLAVLATVLALAVLGQVTVPEGGAAGEETPPGGGTEDGAEPGAEHPADGERAAAAAAGAEEELDEDESDLPPDVRDDPKRLRTRYRRLQRQHGTVARIAERFRGTDGRYLPPEEIDRVRARAADMDEVQALLDENADIVQLMLERKRGGGRAAEPAAEEPWQDPYAAVLDKLPFDPEHASSQWFLNEFRRLDKVNHELRSALKKVEQGVGSVQQRETQRTEQQIEGTWKTETLAAARTANLAGEDLEDFVNTVYANFRAGKAERRLDKLNRQQIIERALRPFKRARTAGSRQAAVGAHTRAEGNRTLPGPHSRAAASPATAHDTNTVGTIKDGRRSFFKRLEMQAPPGR